MKGCCGQKPYEYWAAAFLRAFSQAISVVKGGCQYDVVLEGVIWSRGSPSGSDTPASDDDPASKV